MGRRDVLRSHVGPGSLVQCQPELETLRKSHPQVRTLMPDPDNPKGGATCQSKGQFAPLRHTSKTCKTP